MKENGFQIRQKLSAKKLPEWQVADKKKKEEMIKIGAEVEATINTTGWKYLYAWIQNQISLDRIFTMPNNEEREKIISEGRAYRNFIKTIELWIARKNKLIEGGKKDGRRTRGSGKA